MKVFTKIAFVASAVMFSAAALADPVGTWRTIDDQTGQPRSLVRVTIENGKYVGRVIKLLNADSNICTTCKGKYAGKDLSGVTVFWGVVAQGANKYGGGSIVDPKTGTVYSVSMNDNGKTMVVRGYKGVSLLGRNQTWQRQ